MFRSLNGKRRLAAATVGLALLVAGCGDDGGSGTTSTLSGTINGDGSSTVFPIMEAVAEDLKIKHPGISVQVGESGTGGGFEKFCEGETDFSNASRAIKDEEAAKCAAKGVQYAEFKVASDGLSIVSNKALPIDCLTVSELKKTFVASSTVKKAVDIKAGLPDKELKLFTPGADSGTYDFFLEEVLGKESKYRSDPAVTTSEDDNLLVQGVEGSNGSGSTGLGLGFFGYAYFQSNADKLNLVGVDDEKGCVKPSDDTVRDGSYPLSRPLFIYIKTTALARPEVKEMIRFVLTDGRALITEVGYTQLEDADYQQALGKIPA